MFRAASRLPRRAILTTSVAATGVVLHTSPEREKLSIYPHQTPDILLVDTPSALEEQIGVARRKFIKAYCDTHSQVQGVISRWIGVEHAIENRVKAIISPNESLTPGLLYVGVATLTGSIIARSRFIGARLFLPPVFLFASAQQFLPQTTANLKAYLGLLEDTYFPNFSKKHAIANAHTRMTWDHIKDATQNSREWVTHGAEVAVDKVQEATGLKLKETMGWAQKQAEVKVIEAANAVEQRASEAKAVVEKVIEEKVPEIKVGLEKVGEETKEQVPPKVEEIKRLV
ncbi:hypothetical protein H0H81_011881 [Sphagnurus paluster]|uniref:MICOS complex subunit n=1 Tax=Sphagnurus paluster TaxID=117069 RepID=A0A9P7GL54_9AGAR|nr:hypothetical protein H0H81_011881 [Sphagnurus paluster]